MNTIIQISEDGQSTKTDFSLIVLKYHAFFYDFEIGFHTSFYFDEKKRYPVDDERSKKKKEDAIVRYDF